MVKGLKSSKHSLISKTNSQIVVITSAACFVTVFCLLASKSLAGQLAYQNRIMTSQKQALTQLKSNVAASRSLSSSYEDFVSTKRNVIGGNASGTGDRDGDNAQIVLDALPSKYDFPALITSVEKLLTKYPVRIQSISGADDEIVQSANLGQAAPQPVAIPIQIVVGASSYKTVQDVVAAFDQSIRPFQVLSMNLAGDETNLRLSLSLQTYYQPEKIFTIGTEVIKQ